MIYLITIVPPPDYSAKIEAFQRTLKGNKLPDFVPPHVTVKARDGLTDDKLWLDSIKTAVSAVKEFSVKVNGPAFFGDKVLYLSITAPEIKHIHQTILDIVQPDPSLQEQYYEGDKFTPHITLADAFYENTPEELQALSQEVEKHLAPYPTFITSFLRVFEKESDLVPYHALGDLPLRG